MVHGMKLARRDVKGRKPKRRIQEGKRTDCKNTNYNQTSKRQEWKYHWRWRRKNETLDGILQ